jgi:hypothetical protein
MGNKREIMFVGIFFLIFSESIQMKRKFVIPFFILVFLFPLFINDTLRGLLPKIIYSVEDAQSIKKEVIVTEESYIPNAAMSSFNHFIFSNEIFYAHYSMYGVLEKKVEPKFGASFVYLFASFIPRFINENRPQDIYQYYIQSMNNQSKQGFTIHHATGWYLNFGLIGVILGAMLLGSLLGVSYSYFFLKEKLSYVYMAIFCGLIASIPFLIRGGPEAYKTVFAFGVLLPTFVFSLADLKQ